MRHLLLFAFSALFCSSAFAAPTAGPQAIAALVDSMNQRVAVGYKVALSKWDSGKPVEDKPREHTVIMAATSLAPGYQVSPQWAEQLFSAQIEANKLAQYVYLADWAAAGKAPGDTRPDLLTEIRPQLDTLQKTLLVQMAAAAPYRQAAQCHTWVARAIAAGAPDNLRRVALVRATAELCTTPH
ncbi:chorismate mutase [Pseudomonas typographi]|uniref:Chorismate mutase n=1 Tax=Pseudomonas typographi TaxID=2715964 RepID=A0ABR7Z7R3_9PSED|nr:chorismate mutase [Pseudomonas typographi]MBD1551873.1 chorismate mutase [Pseudomonas typographi]MBD1587677.1 chorismate mutase [Pseudomonas typographi]MBD1601580.1 chorismate mutase [Pseudomonas typographi]